MLALDVAGGGRVALIGGEAGAGKTRLARELANEAAKDGMLVLYGASHADVNMPYQPFVEALEFLVRVSDPDVLKKYAGSNGTELSRLVPGLGPSPAPANVDPATARG